MKNIFKSKFFTRLGRRNLIILSVVLLLGVAVYLNYRWFYNPTKDIGYGSANMNGNDAQTGADANESDDINDYFASAELSRQQSRDEALEVLQQAVSSPSEDTDVAATLAQISRIAEDIENEANIEALVMSNGFENCVAVISGDEATVIVSSGEEGLLSTQVAQITTIVYEQAGILPENLTVKGMA